MRFAPRTARTVHSVSELVLFVRHLALGKGVLQVNGETRDLIREAGARLASNARALERALEQKEAPTLEPAAPLLEKAREITRRRGDRRRGPASPPILLHWLARVDDTLNLIARTAGAFRGRPVSQRD